MNRIKYLREEKGLRQSDVALKTGIDQRTLSNYETGKTNPDSYAIVSLADFFGVSCDYLLGVSDANFKGAESINNEIESIKMRLEEIQRHLSLGPKRK